MPPKQGVKAYEPRMMVVLLLYAYCVGIPSSRRIERACYEDLAFRVLNGNQQPDHSRISDFRLVHLDALAGLFVQVLRLCQKSGLVSLGNVAARCQLRRRAPTKSSPDSHFAAQGGDASWSFITGAGQLDHQLGAQGREAAALLGSKGQAGILAQQGAIRAEHGAIRQTEACGAVEHPPVLVPPAEGTQLENDLTIAATRFAARWRHGNQRSISRQLQHRLWIGLAHPLELLRR
jgi:hypothetical protein